jgi:hypothetical protein
MRLAPIAALVCLVVAAPVFAEGWMDDQSDCRYSAPRHLTTPSSGITRIVIHAEAGSLTVTGTPGAAQINANGNACTSDEDFLSRMTLTMHKAGSELHIDATIPQKTVVFGFFQARLDFSVAVPDGVPVSIDDGSGWMKVANVGPTTINDESGAIEVRNVHGSLVIHDESGGIDVDSVRGGVKIEDDSGEIIVKNVAGAVEIEDDSGSITVASVDSLHIPNDDSGSITVQNVRHDVIIDEDSSGSIDVADVGGNFTVGQKSSGGIDYERVAGRVSIPERYRR